MIKPVNLEALSKWVGHIPDDVVRDMADIAPMLSVLGYDPYANPPDYGKADSWVKDNTLKVGDSFFFFFFNSNYLKISFIIMHFMGRTHTGQGRRKVVAKSC